MTRYDFIYDSFPFLTLYYTAYGSVNSIKGCCQYYNIISFLPQPWKRVCVRLARPVSGPRTTRLNNRIDLRDPRLFSDDHPYRAESSLRSTRTSGHTTVTRGKYYNVR